MKAAAAAGRPFSEAELDAAVRSLAELNGGEGVDSRRYRALLAECGGQSHKDWPALQRAASGMGSCLGGPDDATFRRIFARVLRDGRWDAAAAAAMGRRTRPWVVLITGVNGARKTTSCYQPWFKAALNQALAVRPTLPPFLGRRVPMGAAPHHAGQAP